MWYAKAQLNSPKFTRVDFQFASTKETVSHIICLVSFGKSVQRKQVDLILSLLLSVSCLPASFPVPCFIAVLISRGLIYFENNKHPGYSCSRLHLLFRVLCGSI